MPGSPRNHRHEIFCRECAADEMLAAADVRTGFKHPPNARYNGSRLRHTPACRARIDELMAQFADQTAVNIEYLQAQLLPPQVSAQDLFDETGNLKPVSALRREPGAPIKSIKFDGKSGKISEVVLPDKVAVASLLFGSIGAVSDDHALRIPQTASANGSTFGRVIVEDQRVLIDALDGLVGDAAALEHGVEGEL
jgi:hypothetical protein